MASGYEQFAERWGESAQMVWDTLAKRPVKGIPTMWIHVMDTPFMEEMTGHAPGAYREAPDEVYLAFQRHVGVGAIDQYIPRNPLTMSTRGYESRTPRGPTTGSEQIVCDGIVIDSPEAVAEHMERHLFPELASQIAACDPSDQAAVETLIEKECAQQQRFGPEILKIAYNAAFPRLRYGRYGYVNYFMAYALYPELLAKDFALQADLAVRRNTIAARAIVRGGLPRLLRLDHDMADSRGTLVKIATLDAIWFPHLARAIKPLLDGGIRLIWHCDGNLMAMVPRLLEAGLGGFQGFQYEDGMDYEKICRMTDRNGDPLLIWAGASVTTTLPHGSRDDVAQELKWLVAHGPRQGLFLGASSSVLPGTNRRNIQALIAGLQHYRECGR